MRATCSSELLISSEAWRSLWVVPYRTPNVVPENRPKSIPTIHFQGRCFLVSGGVYLPYRCLFEKQRYWALKNTQRLSGKMSVLGCWSPTKPSQFLKVPFQRSPTLAIAVPHWSINLKLWQSKWASIPFELGCIEWAYWNKHSLSEFPLSIRVVVW